tara:strand:+ start:521 stop:748 length:228 start_codon:yes stop_codon:yes gene_type:complete
MAAFVGVSGCMVSSSNNPASVFGKLLAIQQHAGESPADYRNNPERVALLNIDFRMCCPACAITVDQGLPGNWYGP